MDLNALKVFYEVCKSKSFTKASKKLYVSQSAVSIQIKKLEKILDVKLIERNAKNFRLTSEGKDLFNMTEEIFDKLVRMENDITRIINNKKVKILLGATHNIGEPVLPTIIREYTKHNPNIEFDIFVKNSSTLINYLREGKLDIIFAEDLDIKDNSIKVINTDEYPFVIIAPNEYNNKEDLKKYYYLKRNVEQTAIYMNKFEEKTGYINDKIMNVNGSIETTKKLVAMGFGYAVVPYYCVHENILKNEFKIIHRFPKSYNKFQIMYVKERITNRMISDFVSFVRKLDISSPLKEMK